MEMRTPTKTEMVKRDLNELRILYNIKRHIGEDRPCKNREYIENRLASLNATYMDLIDKLPTKEAFAIRERYLENEKVEGIAVDIGVHKRTVMKWLAEGIEGLAKHF